MPVLGILLLGVTGFTGLSFAAEDPLTELTSGAAETPEIDETGNTTELVEAAYQFALAKLFAEEAAFDKAAKSYEKALELDSTDPYSFLELAKFRSYQGQISQGSPKAQMEHLERAVEAAEQARHLAPGNTDVLETYAQIHLQLGRYRTESLELALKGFEELRAQKPGDLQALTSLGQLYLWKRQPAQAAEVLKEATRYLPNHRMVYAMLVEAQMSAGLTAGAEESLRRLVVIDPGSVEYRLQLATMLGERDDHRGAVEILSAAPESLFENKQLRRLLARELYASGEHARALDLVDALLADATETAGLRRLKIATLNALTRYEDALAEYRLVLEPEPRTTRALQDIVLYSRVLERLGRGEDAAVWLEEHLEGRTPDEVQQLQLILASVEERNGHLDKAGRLLEEALEQSSIAQVAFLAQALSEVYQRSEQSDRAAAVLESAAQRLQDAEQSESAVRLRMLRLMTLAEASLWQDVADSAPSLMGSSYEDLRDGARLLHAEALAELGELDQALALLTQDITSTFARRAFGKRVELLFGHGHEEDARRMLAGKTESGEIDDLFFAAQVLQRSRRYAEMAPILDKILEEQPESIQALFLLGVSLERTGQRAESIAAFERLLAVSPDHAEALNYLGYMWAESNQQIDKALSLIHRAVAIDPDNGAFVDSLGWAYFRLGEYDTARRHLEWAARLLPDDPTVFEHLGDLFVVLEDYGRARTSYDQAIDLESENLEKIRRKLEGLEGKGL